MAVQSNKNYMTGDAAMPNIHLTAEHLKPYAAHLTRNEKAPGTVEKYLQDAGAFFNTPEIKLSQKS